MSRERETQAERGRERERCDCLLALSSIWVTVSTLLDYPLCWSHGPSEGPALEPLEASHGKPLSLIVIGLVNERGHLSVHRVALLNSWARCCSSYTQEVGSTQSVFLRSVFAILRSSGSHTHTYTHTCVLIDEKCQILFEEKTRVLMCSRLHVIW